MVVVTSLALGVIIAGSVAGALVLARRVPAWQGGDGWGHPGWSLAAVTGLIYVNQVLFTVYVLRVHHGDPSFIARYLPHGWFVLARDPAISWLAGHFPAPGLLAPSVLRVQAFLELPFVVFAYLTVCWWFGAGRRAVALVWPVSVAWTATFCLIEWSLRNPYTADDIVIRIAACLVVPLWVRRLSAPGPEREQNLAGLLVFAASTVALGWLVLVVYDTALLYNLGHLGGQLPGAALAASVLLAARWAARWAGARRPGRGIDSLARSFGWFLVLFFVPALPVRYGLNFAGGYVSAAAGTAVIAVAAVRGVREAFARAPGRATAWVGQMAAATAAGIAGAYASHVLPAHYTESHLLWAAAAFFVSATGMCALIDRWLPTGPRTPSG